MTPRSGGSTSRTGPLDDAVADIASRSKLSPAQFATALGHAGVLIDTLKARLGAQMVWGRIVLRQRQSADERSVGLIKQMRNQEKAANDVKADDYVLQRIVFAVRASATPTEAAIRKREADAFRLQFRGCDTALDQAQEPQGCGGDQRRRKLAGEIPLPLAPSSTKPTSAA